MDKIHELVNHLSHQIAMKDEKLSMIAGKERREYMERMRKGRESLMCLIELVEEEQVKKCACSFEGWDEKNFPISDEIMEAPRVSQQL